VGGEPEEPGRVARTPADESDLDDRAQVDALVEAIEQGRDAIELPHDLVAGDEAQAPAESLYFRIRQMGVAQRLKLALRGNKDARTHLLRDRNRTVQRFVLQNPRISEEEIIALAKNRNATEELLRVIGERREWTENYQVRAGLVSNPKTPLMIALRFLPTLGDREIRQLAKSKNIPEVVAGQARRVLAQRTDKRG
jgi:hypothetical protein